MKKFALTFLLIILFFVNPVNADELNIWDYNRDDFVAETLLGKNSAFEKHKQEKIDKELEELLKIKLVPVTLEECLKIAVDNNYRIKEKTHTEKSYKWLERNAYSKFLPDFRYYFSIQHLQGTFLVGNIVPTEVDETPIQSYILVNWNVFNRGKTFFDVKEQTNLHKSAKLLKDFSREEVILNTATNYYQLLQNKVEVDIYKTNLIDRKAQYDLTQARYVVGVGTKFDVYRAEAELAKAKQQYITAFNIIRVSQAKLANVMGVDIFIPLYPADNAVKEKALLDCPVDNLVEYAKSSRKDLEAERKRIEALKAEKNALYTEFIPDININYAYASYGTARAGLYPSNALTLSVSAPLGKNLGVETITQVKASTENIKAAQMALIQKTRDIEQTIITSNQNSLSAKERVEASRTEVFASGKSLESSIKLMNAGVSTFLDVIQAQGLKVNAQVGLAENITDYNIAQVQLLFDSGIISIDNVLNGYRQTP